MNKLRFKYFSKKLKLEREKQKFQSKLSEQQSQVAELKKKLKRDKEEVTQKDFRKEAKHSQVRLDNLMKQLFKEMTNTIEEMKRNLENPTGREEREAVIEA